MRYAKIDINNIDFGFIDEAVSIIKNGGLVVFPTETVYGLACDAFNVDAIERVFKIKHRDRGKALPLQVASADMLPLVARDISDEAYMLAKKYMPGAITLVMKKISALPAIVTGELDTVGVRIPDNKIALALLERLNLPIVATSANLSGEPAATNGKEAFESLGKLVDMVIDGGVCGIGIASTVVDVTDTPIKILRQGSLKI